MGERDEISSVAQDDAQEGGEGRTRVRAVGTQEIVIVFESVG